MGLKLKNKCALVSGSTKGRGLPILTVLAGEGALGTREDNSDMIMWKSPITLDQLKEGSKDTLMEHLGIEYLEIGNDYLKARMPVDSRTHQTAGILHGGASAALAETLGSIAASMCVDRSRTHIVGLEINANHIRPVTGGWVTGITTPIHVGKATQIWEIRIYDERDKLVCISRLTVANLDTK